MRCGALQKADKGLARYPTRGPLSLIRASSHLSLQVRYPPRVAFHRALHRLGLGGVAAGGDVGGPLRCQRTVQLLGQSRDLGGGRGVGGAELLLRLALWQAVREGEEW